MAIKKTELYNSLWRSCDELRGGMDASQYKDYILVLLFVKYVSDKWAGKMDAPVVVPEVGPEVSLETVKSVIRSDSEWLPKLEREILSDENILAAMKKSREL